MKRALLLLLSGCLALTLTACGESKDNNKHVTPASTNNQPSEVQKQDKTDNSAATNPATKSEESTKQDNQSVDSNSSNTSPEQVQQSQ